MESSGRSTISRPGRGRLLREHRVVAPVAAPGGTGLGGDPRRRTRSPGTTAARRSPRASGCCRATRRCSPTTWRRTRRSSRRRRSTRRRPCCCLLRPCDVAGLRALDAVMRWDYIDEPFEARRAATLLVALGCDDAAVAGDLLLRRRRGRSALGPGGRRHDRADRRAGRARFRVCALTEAGRAAWPGAPKPLAEAAARRDRPRRGRHRSTWTCGAAPGCASTSTTRSGSRSSEACVGCGTCAYVCPSCHCFDVVDEGDWRRGERVRNWDSCAFGHFTAHASGHNPRPRAVDALPAAHLPQVRLLPRQVRPPALHRLRPLRRRLPRRHGPDRGAAGVRAGEGGEVPDEALHAAPDGDRWRSGRKRPTSRRSSCASSIRSRRSGSPSSPASSASTRSSARASRPSASPRRRPGRTTSSAPSAPSAR